MPSEGAGWSPWVVFGFNPSDGEAVRVSAVGGHETYNKSKKDSNADGDESSGYAVHTTGNIDDDAINVSDVISQELVKAKMVTAEMEAEVKDLRDQIEMMKEETLKVNESHNEQLRADEARYSKEFTTQADLVHELQKTNNELLWSNRELQDRIKSMTNGDEFELFTEKIQESNAIIVALREENERVSKIVEDTQDAATLETCGISSTRPSEMDIVKVVKRMVREVVSVSHETEKLGLCPSFTFQSSSESGESSNTTTKSISECIVELGRHMADARSSETVSQEENSLLRDELRNAQETIDSLQKENANAVCEIRKLNETLEQSHQETTQAQMALQDSEISCQTAAAYKEELDGQLSAAREELEATRAAIDSYVSQLKAMEDSQATTELQLAAARAEVESSRESMNLYVSEVNILNNATHQATLEEFESLKNRYSAVMAEAVEYRLQADSVEEELRRQIAITNAESEEKWATAHNEYETKMHQKDEDNMRLTNMIEEKELELCQVQEQMSEYNLQFTNLLQSKEEDMLRLSELLHQKEKGCAELTELLRQNEEGRAELSELQQKEQDNLELTDLLRGKEQDELRLSELLHQKEKGCVELTELLRQNEEGRAELSELLQQKEHDNLELTDLLRGMEQDELRLSELMQQKEKDCVELTEILLQKDESLRYVEHLKKDNQRLNSLLHEKENEMLRLSELLQKKEEAYVQLSEMLVKAQANESETVSELQRYSCELIMRLEECDCQLFLSRQETIEAEQNSVKSYEQWTRAYEDLQSALVTAEGRERTVKHEMQVKLAQQALELDTAKGNVLDLEEQLRMGAEKDELLHLSNAKQNDYLARIDELISEQSMHLEQLESYKRECSLLGEKNAKLEMDSLTQVGETELKKQIETLSAELEKAQAASQQHIPPLNHLARLAGNDLALRERDEEIENLKKALEKSRLDMANGSLVLNSIDSQAEYCGDEANEFKRENTALRSQISSMELQIVSLGIQVDLQTKSMEDMLTAHYEQNRLLELEIEQLKESSSRGGANAHNNNLEGGVGDDHFSSTQSIKDTAELSEAMLRASNLQHETEKLEKELSEVREESGALRTVINRVLQLIGHDPDSADADVCSAVYAKCLETSELQKQVQEKETLMMELCELLDCHEDTLIPRAMELGSMSSGICSNKLATTNSCNSIEYAAPKRRVSCYPLATAIQIERQDSSSPLAPNLVKKLSQRRHSAYSSPWEDWESEMADVDISVHSDMVVSCGTAAEVVGDKERMGLDHYNSSDILSSICAVTAATSFDEVLPCVTKMSEVLFDIASTLDIPSQKDEGISPPFHIINEVVAALHNKMSNIVFALKNCGFEEKGEPIGARFWQWSVDCIDSFQKQRDHMTELERGANASVESRPLLDALKTAAAELSCDDIDVPLKVRELIKLKAELYETKEKNLTEEQNPWKEEESPIAGCEDPKPENFPYDYDLVKMNYEETEASSERLWKTALQALHVICVALTDAAADKDPVSTVLQNRIEEAISASSWRGRRETDESLSLLNAAAEELGNKAMTLKDISISSTSTPDPFFQEAKITTRDQDSSKVFYGVLQRWGNVYLHTRLNSVHEACQQEIAAARQEAEDWVTSNFNFDNLPCLELKGLQLVLPDEEQRPPVQLGWRMYEENWDKVHSSIKNVAYEVHRAWNESSVFASSQSRGNVAPDASAITELENSLTKARRECDDRCRDLEYARNSVSNLQEEKRKLHLDLDVTHERLQAMYSSQQTGDADSDDGDEKLESPYGIKSVEPKVSGTPVFQPQPQPSAMGRTPKKLRRIW